MLGGGNPVGGSNPSGTGATLNYIGKHAYAYRGDVSVDGSATTMVKLQTQGSYVVGTVQVGSSESGNDDIELILLLNNENIIVQSFSNTFSTSIQGYNELEVLIPPFSVMELTLKVAGGTAPTLTTTAAAVDRIDYVILDATNIQAVATLNYS